jgi:hypothetical protein
MSSSAPNGSSSSSTDGFRTRARAIDALAHAARQLGGLRVGEVAQTDEVDQLVDVAAIDLATGDLERQLDVLPDAAPRQQRVVLERDAQLALGAQLVGVSPSTSATPSVG